MYWTWKLHANYRACLFLIATNGNGKGGGNNIHPSKGYGTNVANFVIEIEPNTGN